MKLRRLFSLGVPCHRVAPPGIAPPPQDSLIAPSPPPLPFGSQDARHAHGTISWPHDDMWRLRQVLPRAMCSFVFVFPGQTLTSL